MLESLFQPLSDVVGLPMDQLRFVLLMLISLPIAVIFRHYLHPSHTSLSTRHIVSSLIGLTWATVCFDWDVFILVGVVAISYVLLHVLSPSVVQRYTMAWVMVTLSIGHIYRMVTDFGGYHLDFSGSLMLIVQRLSLVAFAVHDGKGGNPQPLNKDQEHHKLESIPSLLEYTSYVFSFHTVLAGPTVTMREHLDFIDGSNLKPLDNPNQFARAKEHSREPSTLYPVLSKLAQAVAVLAIYLYLSDYTLSLLVEPSHGFLYRLYLLYVVGLRIRLGFSFIWVLADSINNAAGLGFSGYDTAGNPKWDLATNISLLGMEFAMNLRTAANCWNITTSRWLRRVCFERVTWYPNYMTFVLSSFWHGFYPGYYACLIYLAFALEASKKMRRLINPFFTSQGLAVRWSYHLVTIFLTQLYVVYGAVAQQLMWLSELLIFWSTLYFIPIWIVLIVLSLLPSGRPSKRTRGGKGEGTGVAMGNGYMTNTEKTHKQD